MSLGLEKQHIELRPGPRGPKAVIAGHRIRVVDIVLWTETGQSPDEIVESFPQLTLGAVHAALSYYHDHRVELDQQMQDDLRYVDDLASKHLDSPSE